MDGAAFPVVMLMALGMYLLPTIIAFVRRVPDRGTVAVLNVFLGWTFLGWVVSLANACGSR